MTERPQAAATQLVDNNQVRVTRFDFPAQSETGWHRHEMDYMITALTDLSMTLESEGETKTVFTKRGEVYFRKAGVHHNVINNRDVPMAFVECELKHD